MRALHIDVDGTVVSVDVDDVQAHAQGVIAPQIAVVACNSTIARDHVLIIDDFGLTKRRPINRVAWGLYGRSPIYGPALLVAGSGADVAELLETTIRGIYAPFPPLAVQAAMDGWLVEHPEFPR